MKINGRKVLEAIDEVITFICTFAFVSILIISGYFIYDSVNVRNDSKSSNLSDFKPQMVSDTGEWDLSEIMSLNLDIIGWVTVDDTTIDLPLLQNSEQKNYLNYDFRGRPSVSGSLYLAENETISDDTVIIYGHHIEGGAMLGCLDSFKDEQYLAKHKTGRVITLNETFEFTVVACGQVDAYSSLYNGKTEGFADIKLYSGDLTGIEGKKVFVFSTCTNSNGLERLVVIAVENS